MNKLIKLLKDIGYFVGYVVLLFAAGAFLLFMLYWMFWGMRYFNWGGCLGYKC